MPAERPHANGTSSTNSNRRSSKPLMEKRRRARINQSLAELKNLIVDSGKKENTRYNKLEKADILEMTVKHLQLLHRQKLTDNPDPPHTNKFRAGFNECVHQVSVFVDRLEGLDSNVRMRLINHLATCINNAETNEPRTTVVNPAYIDSEASTSCDSDRRISSSITSTSSTNPATYRPVMAAHSLYSGALPLVASRLPTGEIAFVLPAALMATGSDAYSHVLPLLSSSHHVTLPSPDRASSVISNASDDGGSAPSCSSSDGDNNSVAEMPLELDMESVWRPW